MAIEYAISAGEGTLIDYGEAITVEACDGFVFVLKHVEGTPRDMSRRFYAIQPGMEVRYSQVYDKCETGR